MIDELIEEFLRERWREYPVAATSLGIDGHDDDLTDLSAEGFAARQESEDRWLARFDRIDGAGFTLEQLIDRDLITSTLRGQQIMRDWTVWKRDPATYVAPGLTGVFALFLHRVHPEEHIASAAAARLRKIPGLLDEGMKNLDHALVPKIFVERALGKYQPV